MGDETPPLILGPHYLEIVDPLYKGELYFVSEGETSGIWCCKYWGMKDSGLGIRFWYKQGAWIRRTDDGLAVYSLHFVGLSDINDKEPPAQNATKETEIPQTWIRRCWWKLFRFLSQ